MEKQVAKLEEKMSVSQHVVDDVSEQLDIKIDKDKGKKVTLFLGCQRIQQLASTGKENQLSTSF